MKSKNSLLAMIILIGFLPQASSDIYAPSLPAIASELATAINSVQLTMAIYMLGVSLSQLFYGPLSEGIGRRPTLMLGLAVTLFGNLLCVFAPNITILLTGRLIQGAGTGACAALWRCIFRDTFEGADLAKYASYLSLVFVFVLPAVPTLGGYLQQYAGWRSIFWFLMLYTVISMAILYRYLPETSQHHHPERLKLAFIHTTFGEILSNKTFMLSALAVSLTFGALFSWITVLPALLIHHHSLLTPVTFGWLILICSSVAIGAGGLINGRLVGILGGKILLRFGWSLGIFTGLLLLLSHQYLGINVIAIFICMTLFLFSTTFIWPHMFANAFSPFGHIAGYAASLYGSFQIGGSAIVGSIVSYLPDQSQVPLAIVLMLCSALAWLCYENQ